MTPAPKRRWFRWSLRTMFVLTTIAGWGLACRPYWIKRESRVDVSRQEFLSGTNDNRNIIGGGIESTWSSHSHDGQPHKSTIYYRIVEHSGPNPQLLGPATALAALVGWTGLRMYRTRSAPNGGRPTHC
jgi:hypothetical protein